MVLASDLDPGFAAGMGERDLADGRVFYHNEHVNLTTVKHPYIKEYRRLFNALLTQTKKTKQQAKEDIGGGGVSNEG